MFSFIDGGVTAPQGFTAAGVHCGIRKNRQKRDLGLIVADRPAAAAGVYPKSGQGRAADRDADPSG